MAQLQSQFNAQQFDPTNQGGGYKSLPVGKQPVVAVASEIKPNKSNQGGMVVFDLEVIDGPAKGASGQMYINLYHQDEKVRAIAESQMAALCYATGQFVIQETAALHNKPFCVDVEPQPLTPDQQAKKDAGESVTPFTQVRKILNIDGSMPGQGGQQQQPQQTQQYQPQASTPAPQTQQWASPASQQAANPGWQGGGVATPPPPAANPPAASWQQGAAAGGKPAWGQK
jgi:hypothetical protein